MSSHREAPEISKDPVADSTDLYAFVSPDRPDTVTLIANYVPLQDPAGGPNFFEFGDDVLYQIHVSHSGSITPDVTYSFAFTTEVLDRGTFLYNTGQIRTPQGQDLQPAPVLHGVAHRPARHEGARQAPRLAALQRRAPLDPRLPVARGVRRAHPPRRPARLRRAARRRLPRRPGRRVRPARPAPVPEPAPDPDRRRARREQPGEPQRAQHRPAGPDHRRHGPGPPDRRRSTPARRSASGRPPAGAPRACTTGATTATPGTARGGRCRAWATRWSTRC